jgi:asparagine synthase (glutamine-hydrolysing)
MYSLTFNGEIYNYREIRAELEALGTTFLTSSDTEVLLEALIAWGVKALDKLEGMFAFGFLDKNRKKLLLARDPFGIKPMLYSQTSGKFGFASDTRALRALFPNLNVVNRSVASKYLLFGDCERVESSFIEGIQHLLTGNFLFVDLAGAPRASVPISYWAPNATEQLDVSFDEATDEFRRLFLESVSLHMRSDVPVGAALSGGLDSSSIVGAMRHLNPSAEIHTFSFIDRNPRLSEENWVDLANAFNDTIPHKIFLDSKSLFDNDFDALIKAQTEPFPDLSIYSQFKVFEAAKRKGITVSLDGQGADELLAGYWGFPESRIHSLVNEGDVSGIVEFLKGWLKYPDRSIRGVLSTAFATYFPAIRRSEGFIKASTKFGIMGDHSLELFDSDAISFATSGEGAWNGKRQNRSRRLAQALAEALGPKRLTSLLRYSDRNSMHSSLESRVPFLTRRMAEFTLSLPERYLLSQQGETKHILRKALAGIVPTEILNRKDKIGFEAGTRGWGLGSTVLKEVAQNLDEIPLINPKEARKAITGIIEGQRGLDPNIWRVINHARWVQVEGVLSS